MTGVALEIVPEPSPAERAAIEAALAPLFAGGVTPTSAWWQAGVLESTEDDEAETP